MIWLDHRLPDQLILIKVLDWFSRQNLGDVKLSLICVGRYPGKDHFVGLGGLTANQLASLADTRLPVAGAQFRTAQVAWNGFTSPDPTVIERFIETDTSALPFIAALGLSSVRRPLIQISDASQRSLGEVTITEAGRDVIAQTTSNGTVSIDGWAVFI